MTRHVTDLSWQDRIERRRQIAAAVSAGDGSQAVSTRFGVSISTIRDACREFGVRFAVDSRPKKKYRLYAILADLINTADSLVAIGEGHGVSKQRVNQISELARTAGIKVEKRK